MMTAYNELYLDDAMHNLADMVDYAVCDLGFEPDEFFGWFVSSGIASKFEKGNPKYIAGIREVVIKGVDRHDKRPDFLLVDANGYIDILEIKKPQTPFYR